MEKKTTEKIKRILEGTVVSDKMDKTRVVLVERMKKHQLYKKYYKASKKFKAHDEKNQYKEGDRVLIEASRPISKDKKWIIKGLAEKK
jgi:small subunit ribosomal protein S17